MDLEPNCPRKRTLNQDVIQGFKFLVTASIWQGPAVTQHTTACCSMQVVDITLAEQASTNITSLRMVQQKYCGPKYKLIIILLQTKA
jgi:hypothetical protein